VSPATGREKWLEVEEAIADETTSEYEAVTETATKRMAETRGIRRKWWISKRMRL